jgi:hypothetical protein
MTVPRFKDELLYYEVTIPVTEEGLMIQVGKWIGDLYNTAIEGYRHHKNGDIALVERNRTFRRRGDRIVKVEEDSMRKKPFQYVYDALAYYAKIQTSVRLTTIHLSYVLNCEDAR